MSLIQFPHQELFEEQLGSFDLIILQNFDANARANYNRNYSEYLLDGGAIVVIGGDLGLSTGDYSTPPFSKLLPVLPAIRAMETGLVFAKLTTQGQAHPITAWLNARMGPQTLNLPPLQGFNPSQLPLQGHAGAQVLLETKAAPGATSMPLLAIAEPGKGRILQLLTGTSWRWGFAHDLDLLQGLRPYDKLWQEIIRWSLHEDPQILSARLSQTLLDPGQPLRIDLRTRKEDGSNEAKVPVKIRWKGQGPWQEKTLRSDAQGRAQATIHQKATGLVHLELSRPSAQGAAPFVLRKVAIVGTSGQELSQLDPDPVEAELQAMVERSGGRYMRAPLLPSSIAQALVTRHPDQKRALAVGHAKRRWLWSHPLSWLAAVALLAEWWLRRRQGLA